MSTAVELQVPLGLQQSTTSPSRDSFQNASGFAISGGQFVSGDVHYHTITPPPAFDLHTNVTAEPAESEDLADSEVYSRQLLGRRRGFPLYDPAPQPNLPEEYQQRGIMIGDVGRVTPEGVFDFFFNIYTASDHPINLDSVPEDFVPLTPMFLDRDILRLNFQPRSHVASPSVQAWDPYSSPNALTFTCKGPRGAVLALPRGSHLVKLQNLEDLRRYAARHAESWYKYINGTRGRGLRNGALHLVTGFEKSQEGGLASFQNIGADRQFHLVFVQPMDDGPYFQAGTPAITKSFQTFPLDSPANNTVFFHGFTISLGEGIWGRLFGTVDVSQITDTAVFQKSPSSFVPFGSQSSLVSWITNLGSGAGSFGGKTYSGKDREEVTLSDVASTPEIFHPSRLVNNFILSQVPNAEVVITHDDDWCDIISENGAESIKEQRDLLEKVASQFFLAQRDGAYFLASTRPPPYPSGFFGPDNFPTDSSDSVLGPRPDHEGASASSESESEFEPEFDPDTRKHDTVANFKRRSSKKKSVTERTPTEVGSSSKQTGSQGSNLACLFCRSRKIKCDLVVGSNQCQNCERRALVCEYPIPGSSQHAGNSMTMLETGISSVEDSSDLNVF